MERPGHDTIRQLAEPEEVKQEMANWAGDHIAVLGEHVATANDPKLIAEYAYYQDLGTAIYKWHLADAPAGVKQQAHEELRTLIPILAEKTVKGGAFGAMVKALQARSDLLEEIKTIANNGESVAVLTNHPWLTNLPLTEAAFYAAWDDPEIAGKSTMIINKMLAWIDFVTHRSEEGVILAQEPSIKVMASYSNVVTGLPRSDSTTKRGLNSFANEFNRLMIWSLMRQLRDGTILFTAPSASADLMPNAEAGRDAIIMKRAADVTARILGDHCRKGLAVATFLHPETHELGFHIGDLQDIQGPEDVHRIMEEMEEPYEKIVEASLGHKIDVRYASAEM